jgi:hypothetical protein
MGYEKCRWALVDGEASPDSCALVMRRPSSKHILGMIRTLTGRTGSERCQEALEVSADWASANHCRKSRRLHVFCSRPPPSRKVLVDEGVVAALQIGGSELRTSKLTDSAIIYKFV